MMMDPPGDRIDASTTITIDHQDDATTMKQVRAASFLAGSGRIEDNVPTPIGSFLPMGMEHDISFPDESIQADERSKISTTAVFQRNRSRSQPTQDSLLPRLEQGTAHGADKDATIGTTTTTKDKGTYNKRVIRTNDVPYGAWHGRDDRRYHAIGPGNLSLLP